MNEGDLCPQCGSSIVLNFEVPKPHYARRECIGVDHHNLGWEPSPWTYERACNFVMPFGKHRGATMARIHEADRSYLQWCAIELDGNIRTAAKLVLGGAKS